MIRVQCPHCKRRYRTEMEAFGRTAVCTKCYEAFEIGASRPAFEWKQTDICEDSWIGVEPPQEKQELKHCINCDAPLAPGAARCLACGTNQVTGLVERAALKETGEPASGLSAIPLRPILIALAAVVVVVGAAWLFRTMTRSAVQMGDELTDQTLLLQAGRYLRQVDDAEAFAKKFAGRVTDDNLPRFVRALWSPDAGVRRTGTMLIGCGQIADVGPVVVAAQAAETAEAGREALQAIGVRRLVTLASQGSAQARESAARGLCLLFRLNYEGEDARQVAAPMADKQKVDILNRLCGFWSQGTGPFAVTIGRTASVFAVSVEQVGRVFYLRAGSREFCSSYAGQRQFDIPIDQWCSATGTAVDAAGVRELLMGSITLLPVIGEGWEGTVRATAKQTLRGPLPGFLPLGDMERGRMVEAEIRLRRGAT